MQLYTGMDIGTAKLTEAERQGIAHHLLDIWSISHGASVAEYQALARSEVSSIAARGALPIFVGGSGLYVNGAIDDLQFPGTDPAVRAELEAELTRVGAAEMHQRLADVDPAAALAILPGNGRRIVRALEVIQLTGKPFLATLEGAKREVIPAVRVALRRPRPELDARIEQRVDHMFELGLVDEVEQLAAQGLAQTPTASRALGYAQVLKYLQGELTREQARTDTVTATRRFARKQESWFGRDERIHWLDVDAGISDEQVAAQVVEHYEARCEG